MKKKFFISGLVSVVFLFGFASVVFACPPSSPKDGFVYECVSGSELPFQKSCSEGQKLKTVSAFTSACGIVNESVCIGWQCEGEAKSNAGSGGSSDVEDCLGACVSSAECNIEVPDGICASGKVCCADIKAASTGGEGSAKTVVSTDGAQCQTPAGVSFPCPLGQGTAANISTTIGQIIKWISGTIGALFLAMFVWGGVLFITAGGSAEKVKAAQGTMTSAVIGMLIIVFSFVLVDWLIGALGSAL